MNFKIANEKSTGKCTNVSTGLNQTSPFQSMGDTGGDVTMDDDTNPQVDVPLQANPPGQNHLQDRDQRNLLGSFRSEERNCTKSG